MPEFKAPTERVEDFLYELNSYGERSEHLKPVLEDVMDLILDRERRLFETRGATGGKYWTPLKPITVKRKQRHPFPERPLWRTGKLMESLSQRGSQYQDLHVDDESLRLASTHPAADIHAGGHGVPIRPPLVIPAKHASEYVGMINDFIFGEGDYGR